MSNLAITATEEKQLDSQVEQMMDWAKSRQAEAEQLALDSARLMACSTDRVDRLKKQGFFQRCWNRFTGKAGEMERANVSDIIQMQKISFRYVNMLQEQQVLMAHSLLSLKNNLYSLAVNEEETRNLIGLLAQRTLERFENLESRVDQIEISTNLQGWLLGLEERDYDEKIPTENMRLFRVINDFYGIKNDNWNYNDLIFMRKAIRTVGINPKKKLSLNTFIDNLTDEIQSDGVGFEAYGKAIAQYQPKSIDNYSKYVLDNISSPVFVSLHALKTQYMDRLDIVEELEDEMNISTSEALKRLLRRSIANMNVDLDYEFPLAETAIEILGCLRLAEKLVNGSESNGKALPEQNQELQLNEASSTIPALDQKERNIITAEQYKKIDINKLTLNDWKDEQPEECGFPFIYDIIFANDRFFALGLSPSKKLVIRTSTDLKNWEPSLVNGPEIDSDYTPKFKLIDGLLMGFCGNYLITSDDLTSFNIYKMNDDIVDAYYSGGTWYILCPEEHDYSYTKSGVIFDSTKTATYTSFVIYYGSSLDNLSSHFLSKDFPMFTSAPDDDFFEQNKISMAFAKGFLVTPIREVRTTYEQYLAVSQNGNKWDKLDSPEDEKIISIWSFDNSIFLGTESQKIYSFDPETQKFTEHLRFGEDLQADFIHVFDDYGVVYYYSYGNCLITNDMKSWRQFQLPFNDNHNDVHYAIAGNQFIAWQNKGALFLGAGNATLKHCPIN